MRDVLTGNRKQNKMKGMFVLGLAIGLFLGAVFGVVIYAMVSASKKGNIPVVYEEKEPWEYEEPDYYNGY